jgi:hypothetical protein
MSADTIADKIIENAAATLDQTGGDVVRDIQDRIGESYPPASDPGEPPHRRTGGYQAGFVAEASKEGDLAQVTISNPTANGLDNWLENGTSKMEARPHFGPTYQDWKERLPARLANTIQSDFPT